MKQISLRYINLDYLDQMSMGDLDTKKLLLEMLLEELPESIQKLQELYQQKNWKAMHETSHKMKSTLAFVGNREMTRANLHILEGLRAKQPPSKLLPSVNLLARNWPLVRVELEKVYQTITK